MSRSSVSRPRGSETRGSNARASETRLTAEREAQPGGAALATGSPAHAPTEASAGVVRPIDGDAVVYCNGAFRSTYGKTAHGLVRFTNRYRLRAVIDADCVPADGAAAAGRGARDAVDAGELLDGRRAGIPVVASLTDALAAARRAGAEPRYFVVGVATDGGVVTPDLRGAVHEALAAGLSVDSGLHEFFSDDAELCALARRSGAVIRDVRKTPPRSRLHAFSGRIETVGSLRIAVLGTDSAIGKRTTAWLLVQALAAAGIRAEMIGTGQTAWMQGARFSTMLDSLVNDFVAGELEHTVVSAWEQVRPEVMVIEGQGSLMNPAYPGGLEILAATRPHAVVLQHAPARRDYDGFPGYPIQPLAQQIEAIRLLSGRPVIAVTVNHEQLDFRATAEACRSIARQTGLPVCAPLRDGVQPVVDAIRRSLTGRTA